MGQTDTALYLGGEQRGKQAAATRCDECYVRGAGMLGILGMPVEWPKREGFPEVM